MFKVKEMSLIRIAGSNSRVKSVIDSLYELKLLHIESDSPELFEFGKPFFEATHYSQLLLRLRAVLSLWKVKRNGIALDDLVGAEKKFYEIESELNFLNEKTRELIAKKAELSRILSNPLIELKADSRLLSGYKSIAVFHGIAKKPLRQELEKKNIEFELIEKPFGKKFAIALFVSNLNREKAQNVLANCGFVEQQLPESFETESIESRLADVSNQLKLLEKKSTELLEKNAGFVANLEFSLTGLNEKAEAPLKFSMGKNSFIVSGWIPVEKLKLLEEKISASTNGTIFVEELHSSHDKAPIAFENPKIVEPFEFFLNLYSLPKYYELDPSILMAFTFPLFFGFMLGDVGYGIVTLLLFFLLKKFLKSREAGGLLNIMIFASIATILFGFVFGEFFGTEFIEHPLLNRAHDLYTMIGISVLIGFIHLNLGLILGFYNKLKHHGLKHAFFEKASWMVLEIGIILIAAELFLHAISFGVIAGGILALGAIAMLYIAEGPKGIIELPAIFSNMLSYSRLFAVGFSSVLLAAVVNKMAGGFFEAGGLMAVVGIVILVLGHAVNIALGILGPFLHALRLHYVEFFSKFFEGGGKKFLPFGELVK